MTNMYVKTAQVARALSDRVRTNYFKHISEQQHGWDYNPDIMVSNQLFALNDEVLGMVMTASTASNLRRLGYSGPRSENGGLSPFMTALFSRVTERFGPGSTIEIKYEDGTGLGTRSILNRPDVINFWHNELNDLILKLLGSYQERKVFSIDMGDKSPEECKLMLESIKKNIQAPKIYVRVTRPDGTVLPSVRFTDIKKGDVWTDHLTGDVQRATEDYKDDGVVCEKL